MASDLAWLLSIAAICGVAFVALRRYLDGPAKRWRDYRTVAGSQLAAYELEVARQEANYRAALTPKPAAPPPASRSLP